MNKIFDTFSTVDGQLKDMDDITEEMEKDYSFRLLPERVHITKAAATAQTARGLEPVVHSKFTKRAREKLLSEEMAKRAREDAEIDIREEEEEEGGEEKEEKTHWKPIDPKGMSKSAREVAEKIRNNFVKTSKRVIGKKTGTSPVKIHHIWMLLTASLLVGVPSNLQDVCNIVGACKLPEYETMFLFHFYNWKGHDDEYRWMPLSEAGNIESLTDADEAKNLVEEAVYVYWTSHDSSEPLPWKAKISDFNEESMVHRIDYFEDADCENLDLCTLQVSRVHGQTRPKFQRETWMLDGAHSTQCL
jgi:hypothetical protein